MIELYAYSTTNLSKNYGVLQLVGRVTFVCAHWPHRLVGAAQKILTDLWSSVMWLNMPLKRLG